MAGGRSALLALFGSIYKPHFLGVFESVPLTS